MHQGLKKASIGIGMGITGTDVTKEVADIIVTDGQLCNHCCCGGRRAKKFMPNIQKTVKFLISANMGELLSLLFATNLLSVCHLLVASADTVYKSHN